MLGRMLTGRDVIEKFGGLRPLAEIAGCTYKNCDQWSRNGVPAKYWDILVDAARRKRIAGVTFAALREGSLAAAEQRRARELERKRKRDRAAARVLARQRREAAALPQRSA